MPETPRWSSQSWFAETTLENNTSDPSYLQRTFFSDEATFHVSGVVNRHNVRIWGKENPRVYHQREMNSPYVNVWCAVLRNQVIGPYFFPEETVNQVCYLTMLEEYALPILRTMPRILFQQDGASPHWALRVRALLDTECYWNAPSIFLCFIYVFLFRSFTISRTSYLRAVLHVNFRYIHFINNSLERFVSGNKRHI